MSKTVDHTTLQAAIHYLKSSKKVKSNVEIANKMEYTAGTFSAYASGLSKLSTSFIEKFEAVFKLSLKDFISEEIPSTISEVKGAYNLATKQSNAKAIADPPNSKILPTEGIIPLADGKFLMNTPLIPIKAYAGYITSWGDEEYISDLPVHPIIVDQAHRGEYKSFEVTGDSMDDGTKHSIENRSIATGRRLDRSHWKNKFHLKKFSRFIIVSLDGILIKEITDHDTKTGIITCHSLNLDKKQYPDFELSLDRVIQIFNVVQVTKKE